jgi:hypothetical protein
MEGKPADIRAKVDKPWEGVNANAIGWDVSHVEEA